MTKFVIDAAYDAALNYIKNNCNRLDVCSQVPTTRAEAITTYSQANVAMDTGDFTGPADHTTGRKITVAAQNGLSVTVTAGADHVALTSATELLLVTDFTEQTLTSGNTVNVGSFEFRIPDVT